MAAGKTILYVHGMGGGGDSRIPSILREVLAGEAEVVVRTYDFRPETATEQLSDWFSRLQPDLVVGESMGALHAIALKGVPHLLVSPALGAASWFRVMAVLVRIPGMTSLFDRVWHPREGDRQPLHFVRANLLGWPDCRRRALRNATRAGGTDYFFAFFGRHDHYRRSGVVSIRAWKKFFGPGSWTVYDGTTSAINDDIRAAWDKAMEGLTGVRYEPIRLLASQVVNGTNYAILARGTTVTAEPSTDWYVVKMYVDLQGNAEISSIERIDLTAMKVADTTVLASELMGGWQVVNPDNSILEPEDAQKAFTKANEQYVGVSLSPIATLGTQVVSGTNYLVLCTGTPATENPTNQLYLVEVYADLQGGAQITQVEAFDLLSYLG